MATTARQMREEIRAEWLAAGKGQCSRLEPHAGAGAVGDGPEYYCGPFCTNCGRWLEQTGTGRGWRHLMYDVVI